MTRGIRLLGMGIALGVLAMGVPVTDAVAAPKKEKEEQQAAPQQQLSQKVVKGLKAASDAMQKQDWETALAGIQEAQAVPDRKPYDDFQIAEMLGYVQLKREKYAEAAAAFEQSLASGLLPATETHDRLKLVTQLHLQLKNYPKAVEFGTRLLALTSSPPPDEQALVAQARYLAGDYKGAVDGMTQAIDAARKTGKPVEENWLQVQLSGYVQLKDAPGVLAALKELAVAYPKKNYLTDLFGQWKREQGDDRLVLNLYRVMFHLGLLEFSEDYLKMAQLATDLGFPGEAITVLEKGNADKKFTDEVEQVQYKKQLASAKTLAVTDRKTVASLEQAGTKSGEESAQLGLALASYEQYDKAATALKSGIDKGGVKRLDQAQIMLGYSLVKLNRVDEAQAAFASVDPSSPLSTIAKLWAAYTKQPL